SIMAFCVGSVLVLSVLSLIRVRGEVSVDCGRSSVSVRWTDSQSLTDPWFLRLGSCLPSSISVRPGGAEAIFYARFDDCSFRRLVRVSEFSTHALPADWRPPMYDPMLFLTNGKGDLVFHMNFMKEDFSGVATSTTFPLGSLISIAAAVEQQAHQPLVLLLEECVASTTPELEQSNKIYPIIANKGCLIESKKSNSRFLPRRNPSEIRMYLQAFKFALGEDVYIHCKLVAWDPKGLDNGRKACHYDKNNGRWELLDNVLESGLCACCDTQCRTRNKRELNRGRCFEKAHPVVLGPLTVTD
uniref:Zona pellucida glycoprotein 3f, tandem duplicate 1 n=1 Tax=Astyanax mexicanus TaxID=7994 RepID=A0A3B1K700_ASTMX